MTSITVEELEKLYAPFALNEHRIREGHKMSNGTKIQWFVYVDRAAVQRRLEAVFPGQWGVTQIASNIQADYATVTLRLAIRGIERDCNGGQSLRGENDDMDQDIEKGAFTEAFRRVASMWGVGLYLYEMDTRYITASYAKNNWDEMREREDEAWNKFAQWYKRQFGGAPQQSEQAATPKQQPRPHAPPPQPLTPPTPAVPNNGTWTNDDIKTFVAWGQKEHNFDMATLLAALGLDQRFGEWKGTLEAAKAKVDLYAVQQVAF